MRKLFYRYFPQFAIAFVTLLLLIWGGTWFFLKENNRLTMNARLENMGVIPIPDNKLSGFPSRYIYRFASLEFENPSITIQAGRTELISYSQNPKRYIIGFGDPVTIFWADQKFELSGDPLRLSVRFAGNQPQELIIEAKDAFLQMPDQDFRANRLVLALDPTHEPMFGMRIEQAESPIESLESDNINALLAQFRERYLQ